ncbi:septal ring lytic transglycosylase RlpA family protein [Paraflavitalea sp. CAU 1676]|uniref:septal ring lytic transglycosylase RlpA family protein n=1 Tax=Paraflavitalea sp. CAU 1676 TaxID=3032598 RepID=UPI0023DA7D03|nr:septal ring lytic transglycosylase RlpA family protein [Paraflavitalea sp. CAU 1676]MDF2190054.1 septal ring lytic transglycosylase RlpA family protein [Paraflavitalea sp. CAU 1676]
MKKRVLYALIMLAGMPVVAAAQEHKDSIVLTKQKNVGRIQYGVASFYHNKFEGRKTANGEIFSQKNMTAASNTHPLNCWVRVTNSRNKKSVIVRITDRMHPKNPRLIDLSRTAAGKLGYTGRGLTRVKVEYLGRQKPAPDEAAAEDK